MNHKDMENIYPFLLQAVHNVLEARDIHDMQVDEIQFKIAPDRHLAIRVAADCPPGTQPAFECVQLPGGGVSCKMVCK
jgi:hypothetical protein